MRRLICLLLFALLPCCAAAEEPFLSIAEVAEMTPDYYEGTCKLDGKRTIDFRAPVFAPDVEKMPVMRVRHQMLDQEEALQFEAIEKFENTTSFQKFCMNEEFRKMVGDGTQSGNVGLESIYNLWSDEAQQNMHQIYAE